MRWDAIVIGSGAGGLTAAVALARKGQRVLVLEQHYLPGGWCHSFSLEGYRFSPGVHYIGELDHGGSVRRLYEGLGLGQDLEFCELNPDGFDHFLIGGDRFDVPKGYDRYMERLEARFPHEKEGLREYFGIVRQLNRELLSCEEYLAFPKILALPFKAPGLLRFGLRTQKAVLDRTIHDPLLRGILSAQSGDHGLAPSRVSMPLHASMTVHYYNGGFYPRGGAKRLPHAYIKALRRLGGKLRLRTRVQRILVDKGRAVGVELESGEVIHAGTVVSNADPAVTFGKLVPREYGEKQWKKAEKMEYSVSLLSLFCAVDMDLRGMGFDSGNYWYYRDRDVGGVYERIEKRLPGKEVDGLFLTVTTLKDPGHQRNGHHTIEMFTFLPFEAFSRFSGTKPGERPAEYDALKQGLADKMLAAAENVIPGLRRNMKFLSIGTPLTNDYYCESFRGAAYGTAKTPWQLGPFSFGIQSPIERLYSVGASTISHGVAGAAMSGLIAAQKALGLARADDLLDAPDGSIRVYPADRPEEWLEEAERKQQKRRGGAKDESLEDVA